MEKIVERGVWTVPETTALTALTIAPGASIAAPEGKYVTLTVDGVTRTIAPGVYEGDVRLSVSDNFTRVAYRFGEKTVSDYHAALVYVLETDGEVTVRETEKMSGTWATPAELDAVRDRLETWSQIALDAVIHGRAR